MLIPVEQIIPFFKKDVSGVLHVGAHKAEELIVYESIGVSNVIWVEANPELLDELRSRIPQRHGSYCFAACDKDNEILNFNIANNGESSSLLDMDTHLTQHPHIKYVKKIQVKTKKIDTLFEQENLDFKSFNFLNLDIQGAELLALMGAKKYLQHCDYVYTEVNSDSLYKDCCLIEDLDNFLSSFSFKRTLTKMTSHGWGDALYVRETR